MKSSAFLLLWSRVCAFAAQCCLLACVLLAGAAARAGAQRPAAVASSDAMTRLPEIAALNSLNEPDLKPWHLKASYTRFDSSQPVQGVLEAWWAGKDEARVEVTEGDRKNVYLQTAQGRLRAKDSTHMAADVEVLLGGMEHALPQKLPPFTPVEEQRSFGSVETKCYILFPADRPRNSEVFGVSPTFCVDSEGRLRAAWPHPGTNLVMNQVGSFQGRYVPTQLTVLFGERKVLEAYVDELETDTAVVDLASDGFVPDVFAGPVRISGGVMQGLRLTSVPPKYPSGARADHASGSVILSARIGKDGHVAEMAVISTPRQDLAEAAEDAVKQWTYKPYLLNGVPMEVNTTITINFNLNW